ncbi:hypothetical protein [Streptomyces sp. NPDC005407]|uniref:hypothetical protein n=1 Tax=Streptomyces sp. NPDC005407 TaxID=3155340 RepID=UPI0033A134C1
MGTAYVRAHHDGFPMGCQSFADPRVVAGGDGRERHIDGSRFGDPAATRTDCGEDGQRAQILGEHDGVRDAYLTLKVGVTVAHGRLPAPRAYSFRQAYLDDPSPDRGSCRRRRTRNHPA